MSAAAEVAIARDAIEAAIWVDALRDAGIRAASFERGPGAAFGGAALFTSRYPVLVPEEAFAAARNVIAELGGAGALAPLPRARQSPWRRFRWLKMLFGR